MKQQTPEQILQIQRGNKLLSTKYKIIPSFVYNPQPKPLSRRDKHRLEVKERKK